MADKCLYCYEPLPESGDFHEKCSLWFFDRATPPKVEFTLDQIAEMAKNALEFRIAVPGVQPKLSVSVVKEIQEKEDARLTVVDALGGHYIFKPPSIKYPEMPQNEHVTMRIAEAFGLRVAPASLIRLASGELAYISRRIDRTFEGAKIHMLDMYQITEAHDKYKSSLEKVGQALLKYSANPLLDSVFYFELCVFCFLTGNNDMHLKNFSMIESPVGWVLALAYDLLNVHILLPEDDEELALTLDGKKKKLKRENFEHLGVRLGMTDKQIEGVFRRMSLSKPKAQDWISRSFLSSEIRKAWLNVLDKRYMQLGLASEP